MLTTQVMQINTTYKKIEPLITFRILFGALMTIGALSVYVEWLDRTIVFGATILF